MKLMLAIFTDELTLSQLTQIGPENYADVVEERHINKLCGYPLCDVAVEK